MTSMMSSRELVSASFRLVSRGYECEAVDRFLDEAASALAAHEAGRTAALSAAEVDTVRFESSSLMKKGYAQDAVDEVLDAVAATLRSYEGTGLGASAAQSGTPAEPTVTVPEPSTQDGPVERAAPAEPPASAVMEGDATRRPFWRRWTS